MGSLIIHSNFWCPTPKFFKIFLWPYCKTNFSPSELPKLGDSGFPKVKGTSSFSVHSNTIILFGVGFMKLRILSRISISHKLLPSKFLHKIFQKSQNWLKLTSKKGNYLSLLCLRHKNWNLKYLLLGIFLVPPTSFSRKRWLKYYDIISSHQCGRNSSQFQAKLIC